jgi:hypothetical protein
MMRSILPLLFFFLAAPAFADDGAQDGTFRACVAETEGSGVSTSYHHCSGGLVTHCGASATAKDAVDCIGEIRTHLETHVAESTVIVADLTGETVAEMEATLADTRSSGVSACAILASKDIDAGIAVGQRAVNLAFCELVATGDVYALLITLETAE